MGKETLLSLLGKVRTLQAHGQAGTRAVSRGRPPARDNRLDSVFLLRS